MNNMNSKYSFKSFTLIEVLVVAAIVMILATIIIVSTTRSQDQANNAAAAAALVQARNIAAMIYSDENSYETLCSGGTLNDADYSALKTIEADVYEKIGQNPKCYSAKTDYCVQVRLLLGDYFCIDSTGFSGKIDGDYCADSKKNCSSP